MSDRVYYILEDGKIRSTDNLMEWAMWFENNPSRIIEKTRLDDGTEISTVFLGIDHRLIGDGPPILFETMIFQVGGEFDNDMRRYSTLGDAKIGHWEMVDKVNPGLAKGCSNGEGEKPHPERSG